MTPLDHQRAVPTVRYLPSVAQTLINNRQFRANQLTTDCLTTDSDIHFTETNDTTFVMDEPERTDVNSKYMFEAQRTDSNLSAMIAYLERNELPAESHTARIITAEADQYVIDMKNS